MNILPIFYLLIFKLRIFLVLVYSVFFSRQKESILFKKKQGTKPDIDDTANPIEKLTQIQ